MSGIDRPRWRRRTRCIFNMTVPKRITRQVYSRSATKRWAELLMLHDTLPFERIRLNTSPPHVDTAVTSVSSCRSACTALAFQSLCGRIDSRAQRHARWRLVTPQPESASFAETFSHPTRLRSCSLSALFLLQVKRFFPWVRFQGMCARPRRA